MNNLAFDYDIFDELLMAPKLVHQMFPPATEGKTTQIITNETSDVPFQKKKEKKEIRCPLFSTFGH